MSARARQVLVGDGKATAWCGSGLLGGVPSATYQGRHPGPPLVHAAASPPTASKILVCAVELGTHYAMRAFTLLTQE